MAMFLSRIKQILNLGTKSITANGTYNASTDGYDGYSQVSVNMPSVAPSNSTPAALTSGSAVTPTANGYAIESYDSVTPSSTPTSVSTNDVVKIGGSGVIVDSIPTPTSLTPSNSNPATITSGETYTATASGKAISSLSEVAPSNANPPDMYSGSIYKIKTRNGLLISTASLVSPSDSNPPQLVVNDTYYRINGASGYLYASSGLKKFKSGTVARGTSAVTVNCGFEPKIVCCFKTSTSTGSAATGDAFLLYDSEWSTANVVSAYKSSSSANFQKYAKDNYITTSSTGFLLGGTTSTYTGSYTYFAIG